MLNQAGTKRRLESDTDSHPEDIIDEADEEDREDSLTLLMEMFPDCDPLYIENRISWHGLRNGVVGVICDELITHQYPLMKVRVIKQAY